MSATLFQKIKKELEAIETSEGISPSDVVGFSDTLRVALNHALRSGKISLIELAEMLQLSQDEALAIANILEGKGFFQRRLNPKNNESIYQTRLSAHTRTFDKKLPKKLWDNLDDL